MLRLGQVETNALIEISQAVYVIGSGIGSAKRILADNSPCPNFDFLAHRCECDWPAWCTAVHFPA